jgi:hypothetical protein
MCDVKRARAWRKAHPNGAYHKYRIGAKAYMRNYMRGYRQKHLERMQELGRLEKHRRTRELPTSTILNKSFKGAHLHHITPSVAIYIPKGLHRSVFHNLKTGEGMDEINAKALAWAKSL